MKCIYCSHKNTDVVNSRMYQKGLGVWRRRRCLSCDRVFTTRETALADNLFVVKKSGVRQRFMYEKMFISIFGALNTKKNNDNGVNAKHAKEIASLIIQKLIREDGQGREVSTKMIITAVYRELKRRGRLFADTYAYYSEYRLQVLVAAGLISITP